jgi:membrane protease YdiL (CAAX protease family)
MLPFQLAALASTVCLGLLGAAGRLRFLREELRDPARRLAAALLLFGVLTICVFYPALSGEAAEIDPAEIHFPALFIGHAVLGGFLIAWWNLLQPRVSLARFLLVDDPRLEDVQRGIKVGAMGRALTITGTSIVAATLSLAGASPEPSQIPELMPWMAELALPYKLVIIWAAMTVEEGFFRAFLQTRIGWIPSSILFALSHGSYGLPLMMVSVFIISLLIGWTLRRTGRLLPCIIAHGVFDAIQLLVVIPLAMRMIR